MRRYEGVQLIDGLTPDSLARAEVVYLGKGRFDPAQAPRLKWVQYTSAGVGALTGSALARSDIPVASASGAYSVSVAELALTLLLAMQRRLPDYFELQRNALWRQDGETLPAQTCRGRVMGILGYGSIGREIARLGCAFGMRILVCKRHPEKRKDSHFRRPQTGDPDGRLPEAWYGIHELDAMLPRVDVLVIALPGSPGTKQLVGARELALLPRHAVLINVGRGSVVDEPALMEALQTKRLAQAAVDVLSEEPLPPQSPLWRVSNLLITPHVASDTLDQSERAAEVLIENVRRYLAGESLLNLVDFEAGF